MESHDRLPSNDSRGFSLQQATNSVMLEEVNPSMESQDGLPSHDSRGSSSLQAANPKTSLSLSEEEMFERIQAVIEPMTEMFGTYFKPTEIAMYLPSLDDNERQSIFKDSKCNSEKGMRSLLERLVDMGGKPLLEFYKLITTMDEDSGHLPHVLLSGEGCRKPEEISGLMDFIVELVERKNLGRLTPTDLSSINDLMVKEGLLKKSRKGPVNMDNTTEGFLHLLKQFRKSNHDWPLILWETLRVTRPDLFELKEENSSSLFSGSEQSFDNGASLSTELKDLPSSSSEATSSRSTRSKKNLRKAFHQLQITPKNSYAVDFFIEKGSLHKEQVTYDEVKESASKRNAWNRVEAYFSDGEDEEDSDQTQLKVSCGVSDSDVDLNLREYQKELAESAIQGNNTIVCAPTGCGKTRVALDIIIKHLQGKTGNKKRGKKKVCFFTRTVPLAVQQYNTIRIKLPEKYKINIVTGDSELRMDMHLLLEDLDVVVLTPMILQNHIKRGNVKDLSVFSLLVFDECHHTREKNPYNTLMAAYMDKKLMGDFDLPQVVGLTASFPVEKARNALQASASILQLCANLDAHNISVVVKYLAELKKRVPVPTEEIKYLQERDNDESYKKIINVMEKLEAEAVDCAQDIGHGEICADAEIGSLLSSIPTDNRKLQKYNNWATKLFTRAVEIPRFSNETNMSVRLLMIIAQYLIQYHFALETHDLVHLQDVINYLDDCFTANKFDEFETNGETRLYDYFKEFKESMAYLCHEDNPNLRRLMKVIDEKLLKKGSKSRGIIFVRTRAIAEALALWLNRCENEGIRALKACIFTGTNAKESQGGMTQSQQNALVDKFKEGKVRLLVATSVAEEGIDVPECNLVIKYNHVGNEITTIQTRGRSRAEGGHSVLLGMTSICEKETVNQQRTKLMYLGIELVRKMPKEEFLMHMKKNQADAKEERDFEELIASQIERRFRDKKFTMTCKLCRQFSIQSDSLRTLCGNSRIVVDRDVWRNGRIFFNDPKYIDEIQIIGSVRCRSDVEGGTQCRGPLGALISYSSNYFLAVGVKNFTFDEEGQNKPRAVKRWKDWPYPLRELSNEDIRDYIIKQQKKSVSGIQETEPADASYMASFATTVAKDRTTVAQESIQSEELNEIYERYQCLSVQTASSSLSTYSSSATHHETPRKEVISELDSGVHDSGLISED